MTNPTPSLKEEIESIVYQTIDSTLQVALARRIGVKHGEIDEYAIHQKKAILSAFTQAIERAEPEYMKPCDKPSCKSCSYLRGQQDAKSDYKQRLLAEVK